MHKSFYASGFIYHLTTQQILLQQPSKVTHLWQLFGEKGKIHEDPQLIFRNAISEQLHLKVPLQAIYPVYDYFSSELGCNNHIFYAAVDMKLRDIFSKGDTFVEWFNFKQINKLPLSEQTKHDIIVAGRVINLKARDDDASI